MPLILFALLLIFSFFFSCSETAFFSLGRVGIKQIENLNTPRSRRVVSLLSDPHRLIIAILIGNTLVNTAASSLMTNVFYSVFGEKGVGVSIILTTLILLVLGEATPKKFALFNAKDYSLASSSLLVFFEKLFFPLYFVFNGVSKAAVMALGIPVSSKRSEVTKQEIRDLLFIGEKKGIVKKQERDMSYNVMRLKEMTASDIMTPRIDVFALDLAEPPEELVRKTKESQFSRCPVYVHDLDNIVGVIRSKDFLIGTGTPIKDHVKKAFFAPESMRVSELLKAMQSEGTHIAVITDEYGITSGVVTFEDIFEEIVGEIRDEFDSETSEIKQIDADTFEISGQAKIIDVNKRLSLDIETKEVDTIGGFVMLKSGKMPKVGDSAEIGRYRMTVASISRNRITLLKAERKKR